MKSRTMVALSYMARRPSKKSQTLLALWDWVKAHSPDTLEFSNDETKEITKDTRFSNQFDVTHIDKIGKIPEPLGPKGENVFLVNLGFQPGRHKFVRGIEHAFFELRGAPPRSDPDPWKYVPGHLDDIDDSEAGVLSLAFNQSVFADFLLENRERRDLQVHLPRRTRVSFQYGIGPTRLTVQNLQVEVDFLLQGPDFVGLAEAKFVNAFDKMPDFNVLQLYLPYRRLLDLMKERGSPLKVRPVFALGYRGPEVGTGIRLYEFSFPNPDNASPIRLVRSRDYLLEKRASQTLPQLTLS